MDSQMSMAEEENRFHRGWSNAARAVSPLMPAIVGLGCARVSTLSLHLAGGIQDAGNMMDSAASVLKCVALVVLLVALYFRPSRTQGFSPRLIVGLVLAQAFCLVFLSMVGLRASEEVGLLYAVNFIGSLSGTLAMLFWLVQARGVGPGHLLVYIFLARALSELLSVPLFFSSPWLVGLTGIVTLAAQVAVVWRVREKESIIDGFCGNDLTACHYFSGIEGQFKEQRFLLTSILCCIFLSMAIGIFQTFPYGTGISLSLTGNLLTAAVVVALCAILSRGSLRQKPLFIVVSLWLAMMAFGAMAMVLYSFCPSSLSWGAIAAAVLDSLMGCFKWYLTGALVNLGRKNPYFYAVALYVVFLLPRDFARWGLGTAQEWIGLEPIMVVALAAVLLLVAGEGLFLEAILVLISKESEPRGVSVVVERILGLGPKASLEEMRSEAMRHNVEEIGRSFSLTEREVEVLTLIALGHTQQRAADELFITKNTLHAHMRHIYDKTGLHSRQEVLDYLKEMEQRRK